MEDNTGYIEDPTVKIQVTAALSKYVSSKNDLESLAEKTLLTKTDLKKIADVIYKNCDAEKIKGDTLDKALEKMVANNERFSSDNTGYSLHELLDHGDIKLPDNVVIERNPELAARVERLRLEQNERDYQTMTKSVSAGKFYKEDTIGYQLNMMNRELIAVGQVILSVAAGFAFGFLGIPLIVGGMEFGLRVLLGLLTAGIIAIAELYFLAKYMHAEDVIDQRTKKD